MLRQEIALATAAALGASCGFGYQALIVRSRSQINIECEPTRLRFAGYPENADRLQPLYEKFCEPEGRPAMSRLDQKPSNLRRLVPAAHQQSVQRQLTCFLQLRLLEPQNGGATSRPYLAEALSPGIGRSELAEASSLTE